MKLHGHKFSAGLKYTFSRYSLGECAQCGKTKEQHAQGQCLFESTVYQPHELLGFFELLMREGGVLTLKVGTQTLTQKITVNSIDQGVNFVLGDIQTAGDAFLGDTARAKKRT